MMNLNTYEILENVEACIRELEEAKANSHFWPSNRITWKGYGNNKVFKIRAVYDELSIFDWWNDNLSLSQLKAMKAFLEKAIDLGFVGYACFKVGAKGCAHGMWAYKVAADDRNYNEDDVLFHSFRSGDNYWSYAVGGKWGLNCCTLADVKKAFA